MDIEKIVKQTIHKFINEECSQEEHDATMREMSLYDGAAFEPEVGIFWFNPEEGELFDVVSIPVSQLPSNQNTIGKLHKDVWAKKYHRAVAKKDKDSIYLTDYTQIPRGRIFVDRNTNKFIVKVGNWIREYADVLTPLISDEFNLKDFQYDIDSHWDLGHGWSEHDFNVYSKR